MILINNDGCLIDSEMITCMCGCKGKKKSHIIGQHGGVVCGSCGRLLASYHYQVFKPGKCTKYHPPYHKISNTCSKCGKKFENGDSITIDENGNLGHGTCVHGKNIIERKISDVCAHCDKKFEPGDVLTSNENEDVVHVDCDDPQLKSNDSKPYDNPAPNLRRV